MTSHQINAEWAPNQQDAEPTDQEMIQKALAKGYTRRITADSSEYTLDLLVNPEADLDGRFKAFCMDELEWLKVNGWLFTFEEA